MGCYARQLLGVKQKDLQAGLTWCFEQGGTPKWEGNGGTVDLYYWYYGTLAAFQQGGDLWKTWNAALSKALVDNQRKGGDEDGSYGPVGVYGEYIGRAGQTAMAALCLEVCYRYSRLYSDADEPAVEILK